MWAMISTNVFCMCVCVLCVLPISDSAAESQQYFPPADNSRLSHDGGHHSPTFTVFTNGDSASGTVAASDSVPARRLKILVHNPSISWSHSQFMGAVADTLVDAGHEVHLFGYAMNTLIGNYTGSVKAQKLIWHEQPADKRDQLMRHPVMKSGQFDGPRSGIWAGLIPNFLRVQDEACAGILENKELLAYLRDEHYDFGLSETYSPCPFGVFKLVGVKSAASATAIPINSFITSVYGIPSFSSFVYDIFLSTFADPLKMNFFQRATNLFFDMYTYFTVRDVRFQSTAVFNAALGTLAPSLRDVMRNVSLAFVNSKEFFALPRPLSHKIVYIGGIAAKEKSATKVLPERLAAVIDAPPKGAVLFSFGSLADTRLMTTALKRTFADAFAKFPDYAFIWKLNLAVNETLALPPNVHIFDWVPQAQILEHPRTKLFISHCGLNSANEAAAVGVPVLGIPLFGDQPYNAATIVNKGFGLALDIRDIALSGRAFEDALHSLLNDGAHFAENARLVARKLALTPFSARERLVKWVEFAAEFDNLNELNMPTEDELGLLAYYSVDVMTAALLAVALVGYVAVKVLVFATRQLYRPLKQKAL